MQSCSQKPMKKVGNQWGINGESWGIGYQIGESGFRSLILVCVLWGFCEADSGES